jgi:parallel beta-helix repeat protein
MTLLGAGMLVAVAMLGLPRAALSAGKIEVNDERARSGGVTPGDTPGYPVTISEPGSYVLTGNLAPSGSADGIVIAAGVSNVTLDLAGFAIVGPVVCTRAVSSTTCTGTAGRGIFAEGGNADIAVKDGSIRGMQDGVSLLQATNIRIDAIQAASCSFAGIRTGPLALVENSSAELSGQNGIWMQADSAVRACSARRNNVSGILAGQGCTLTGNRASENFIGITASAGSTLIGNTAIRNVDVGLSAGAFSGYADNVLVTNHGNGVGQQTNSDVSTAAGVQQIGANVCGTDTVCP